MMIDEKIIEKLYTWIGNIQKVESRKMKFGDEGEFFPSDIRLIMAVDAYEDENITQLADHLGVTKGTLSKLIKKLTEADCIIKFKKEDNKKNIYLQLTDKGENVKREYQKFRKDHIESLMGELGSFNDEEKEAIIRFIDMLNGKIF